MKYTGKSRQEGNRPGQIEKEKSSHHMPFSPSSQSAKNTGTVVQCDECGKWRCVYSERKLTHVGIGGGGGGGGGGLNN